MSKFYISIFILGLLLSCSNSENKNRNSLKESKTDDSSILDFKPINWIDEAESEFKIEELKQKEKYIKIFEINHENITYILSFEKIGNKSIAKISLGEKLLLNQEIVILSTLYLGTISIEGKQELCIETSENRPVYYLVNLNQEKCEIILKKDF